MSRNNFQIIDNEIIHYSIIKRDFLKIYQQQAANLKDSDQNNDFFFRENINYHFCLFSL